MIPDFINKSGKDDVAIDTKAQAKGTFLR